MAISLDHLKKQGEKKSKELRSGEKKQTLRPWESFDLFSNEIKGHRAQSAFRKAQEKIEGHKKNAENINELEKLQAIQPAGVEFLSREIVDRPRGFFSLLLTLLKG